MERCENCIFYAKGECVINQIKISRPDICICDDWEPSDSYFIAEFDDDFSSSWACNEDELY